jgi:hypothetical protein
MAQTNKTTPTRASVEQFLNGIENARRRDDCRAVVAMMKEASGERPVMWGPSIIGFGKYHYVYESGREGDMFFCGVSPRKTSLVLYLARDFPGSNALFAKLGKHKLSTACLYINKLDDIDVQTLGRLIRESVKATKRARG